MPEFDVFEAEREEWLQEARGKVETKKSDGRFGRKTQR